MSTHGQRHGGERWENGSVVKNLSRLSIVDHLVTWGQIESDAREREAEAAELPRYSYRRRRHALQESRESQANADRYRAGYLPDDAVARLAQDQLVTAWVEISESLSTRNPFHPHLAVAWPTQVGQIINRASRPIMATGRTRPVDTAEIPGYGAFITHAFAVTTLGHEAAHRQGIAADTRLLVLPYVTDGHEVTVVQHVASGLRARFTIDPTDPLFGGVNSKPYEIGSIDDSGAGHDTGTNWQTYAGLGIGAVIYRQAAATLPGVRWPPGVLSDYSLGLRRKLHAGDPYTWGTSGCGWCSAHGVTWRAATRGSFAGHP